MTRLNLVLLLAVLASALFLVHTQYQSRRLFTELDRATAEARRLETEHQRLQVEKRAQATPLRVEKLARAQLQMRTATPANWKSTGGFGLVISTVTDVRTGKDVSRARATLSASVSIKRLWDPSMISRTTACTAQ